MIASNTQPDQLAFDYTMVGEPVWNRIEFARDVLPLEDNFLLHAGPPFEDEPPTRPILNSACVAAVYDGLASDLDDAEEMILNGDIKLFPAQDFNVVTPLAAVVSPSMPLQAIYDAHRGLVRTFSPINGGNAPAARLGLKSMKVVEHLKWLNSEFAETLASGLAEGISLIPIACESIARGDDCHGRTSQATRILTEELLDRSPAGSINARCLEFFSNCPSLFLNLWMAATKCMLILGENVPNSSLVTTAGGNGSKVGIKLSSHPGKWITTDAKPPKGPFDVDVPQTRALGAIGDSAIVDIYGLGAMVIHLDPIIHQKMKPFLPQDFHHIREKLLASEHIGFQGLGIKLGITAQRVVELKKYPVVSLGIIDREGLEGRLGGGIYDMPLPLFEKALKKMESIENEE